MVTFEKNYDTIWQPRYLYWYSQDAEHFHSYRDPVCCSFMCCAGLSCPTLHDPMDYTCQAPLSMGFLLPGILVWVTISSSRRSRPGNRTHVSCFSCTAGRFFTTKPLGKPIICYIWVYLPESVIALPNSGGNHCYPSAYHSAWCFPGPRCCYSDIKDELREASGMCEFTHSLSLWPSLDGHHVTEWQPADPMGLCSIV